MRYAKLCHALAASRIVFVAGDVVARSSLSMPSETTVDVRALWENDCEEPGRQLVARRIKRGQYALNGRTREPNP